MRTVLKILIFFVLAVMFSGCKYLRYVPENQLLLKKTKVKSDIYFDNVVFEDYLRQTPNNYFMGIGRLKLAMYSASDTAKHTVGEEWLRKIGEPPVIYDSLKRDESEDELQKVMFNKGYLNARVTSEMKVKNRQATITYHITGNKPHTIRNYIVSLPDSAAMAALGNSKSKSKSNAPKRGDIFDTDKLNSERERITRRLREQGYYYFTKELLFCAVDTNSGGNSVDVEMQMQSAFVENDSALNIIFAKNAISRITVFSLRDDQFQNVSSFELDTVVRNGYTFVSLKGENQFRPKAILEKICFNVGDYYKESNVSKTYELLNSMPAVKYVNIMFRQQPGDSLSCIIIVSPQKPHTLGAQLDFTYSSGDIGVMPGISYSNNNIFHGSETLKFAVNGGWEGIGDLTNLTNTWKIGGDIALRFPKLLIPTSEEFKRQKIGATEVSLNASYEDKVDYKRTLFGTAFKYLWTRHRVQYNWSVIDLSLIKMGGMSESFKQKYLSPSSSIRYSYEDNFIMRMAMSIGYTNRRSQQSTNTYFTIRTGAKIAGNLLYGINSLCKATKNSDGQYEVFGIPFAQFFKVDFDYAHNIRLHDYVRMVLHTAIGVAYPYGNSSIMPYEERYYAGGANSVRGWTARHIGPGNFHSSGSEDLMAQSGDIKLDLNLEFRVRAFWKLELAAFLDAGNVWTIKDYPEQAGGAFKWDTFYKQLGVDYGFGIRLNFDFIVVRLDLGVKIYDPSREEADRLRSKPTWSNDCALHFAIGYPF